MATMTLSRGQRIKLTDIISNGNEFQLGITCNSPGLTIDFSCFGLDASEKLSDDRYMTFFNQPSTPCGGVNLSTPTGDSAGFAITLPKLPTTIHHLTVTAAIDGSGTMSQLKNGYVRFICKGTEVARFEFTGADFSEERALMFLDIYRKDNIWRISAIGQGFNGGLDALVRHFGGTVDDSKTSNISLPPALPMTLEKPQSAPNTQVQLSKSTLKEGEVTPISLRKSLVLTAKWLTPELYLHHNVYIYFKTKEEGYVGLLGAASGDFYYDFAQRERVYPDIFKKAYDYEYISDLHTNDIGKYIKILDLNFFSSLLILATRNEHAHFDAHGQFYPEYPDIERPGAQFTIETDTGNIITFPFYCDSGEERFEPYIIGQIDNDGEIALFTCINKFQPEAPDLPLIIAMDQASMDLASRNLELRPPRSKFSLGGLLTTIKGALSQK